MSAKEWIRRLNMTQHPEGGWYVESFRDSRVIEERNASTAIYFYLRKGFHLTFTRFVPLKCGTFTVAILLSCMSSQRGYTRHMVGPNWDKESLFRP